MSDDVKVKARRFLSRGVCRCCGGHRNLLVDGRVAFHRVLVVLTGDHHNGTRGYLPCAGSYRSPKVEVPRE